MIKDKTQLIISNISSLVFELSSILTLVMIILFNRTYSDVLYTILSYSILVSIASGIVTITFHTKLIKALIDEVRKDKE